MTIDTVVEITRTTLYTIITSAAPLLLVSLVVGLLISVFQTITSIQEQTLTFVPKFLAIFVTLMLIGHWMLNNMVNFTEKLWGSFSMYIR